MKWILAAVAAALSSVMLAGPVLAGGWATTLLDPLPEPLQSGRSYTAGFWILQHGSHVSQAPLTNPGLRLVDAAGKAFAFKGVPLAEGGHYATALVVPYEGDWTIFGMQAPFQDYEVGVLTASGRVVLAPTPGPLPAPPDPSWSVVRPPNVKGDALAPAPIVAAPKTARQTAPAQPGPPLIPLLAGAAVVVGAGAALAARRRRRAGRSGRHALQGSGM